MRCLFNGKWVMGLRVMDGRRWGVYVGAMSITPPVSDSREAIHWLVVPSLFGSMLVAVSAQGLCRLSFDEGEGHLATRFPHAQLVAGGTWASDIAPLIAAIVAGDLPLEHDQPLSFKLDLRGTDFQRRVWDYLLTIPRGQTRSYGDISRALGVAGGDRAVGSANGANPVAIIVPCHRVIRSDGSLGGYAWGLDIKQMLLKREGALQADLFG